MKFCRQCNSIVPDDSDFCPFCGGKIVKEDFFSNNFQSAPINVEVALKRAFLFLEDGLFDRSDSYLEIVLDQEPENAMAYLGKLMIDLHIKQIEDLVNCTQPFDDNGNYKKAIRFGDEKLKAVLQGYVEQIHIKLVEKEKNEIYESACSLMQFNNKEKYHEAIKRFSSIIDWKDSKEKIGECKLKLENLEKKEIEQKYQSACSFMQFNTIFKYRQAIDSFTQIQDWKDSSEKIEVCKLKIKELETEAEKIRIKALETSRLLEQNRIEAEKRKKRRRKVTLILIVLSCLIVIGLLAGGMIIEYMKTDAYIYGAEKNSTGITVTKYRGKDIENVVVPDYINGKPVTKIGYRAFFECDSIESVEIPDSVTEIGAYAFFGCSNLASINIPDGLTIIDEYAFYGCTDLKKILIRESVTSIGYAAFRRSGLVSADFIGFDVWYLKKDETKIPVSNKMAFINEFTAAQYLTEDFWAYNWERE